MIKPNQTNDNEISLIDLIIIVLEGKWKIFAIILVALFVVFGQQVIMKETKIFSATTEIKPISTFEQRKYVSINNSIKNQFKFEDSTNTDIYINEIDKDETKETVIHNIISSESDMFPKFTKSNFLNLFLEVLNEKKLFEEAIRKFNLIDINLHNNEEEYNESVTKLASTIKIVKKFSGDKKNNHLVSSSIQFTFDDIEKWKSVLKYVDENANKLVKRNIQNQYKSLLSFIEQQKKYNLEDISTNINNLIADYESKTEDKILFLEEQAAIAEALGIETNSIEIQTFNQDKIPNQPVYLKGYIAINKEIELIKGRTDINSFIPGLLRLEQAKRSIQQDKSLDRIKVLFSNTPIAGEDFIAASANISATEFNYQKNNNIQTLIFTILVGFLIGVFYVVINNALKLKKN